MKILSQKGRIIVSNRPSTQVKILQIRQNKFGAKKPRVNIEKRKKMEQSLPQRI